MTKSINVGIVYHFLRFLSTFFLPLRCSSAFGQVAKWDSKPSTTSPRMVTTRITPGLTGMALPFGSEMKLIVALQDRHFGIFFTPLLLLLPSLLLIFP